MHCTARVVLCSCPCSLYRSCMQWARALLTAWSCCWLRSAVQIKNGCHFVSETDTEVIPKLLKFAYDNWEGERLPFPKVSRAHPQQYAGRDSARQTDRARSRKPLREMPAAQTLSRQRPDMQRWCQHMPSARLASFRRCMLVL